MKLELPITGAVVRTWQEKDLAPLVEYANDREVARQLRDRFPHPYETAHGIGFLQWVAEQPVECAWAIAVDGPAVGGIGLVFQHDVDRVSAEIGYWLGRPFWGHGLATAALRAVTAYAFEQFDLARIFAVPFEANRGSIRVLEKAGYVLEGRMRRSAIKYGEIQDQRLYATYRE
jgi:RimJ/RimL family protein N-acetyltransferase